MIMSQMDKEPAEQLLDLRGSKTLAQTALVT
jgi:hypothetical protein